MTDLDDEDQGGDEQHDLSWPIPVWSMWPLAAALVALVVWSFGQTLVLVSVVPFVALLAAITVIDLRELRVPNRLLAPAAILALPLLIIASTADWPDVSFWRAVLGALAMGAGYFTLAMIYPAGMGFGDVKLAPLIGAQLALFGWIPLWRGLIVAFLVVGPVSVALLLTRRAGRRTGLPFAPFMAVGAVVALVLEGIG